MARRRPQNEDDGEHVSGAVYRMVSRMWSDTLALLHSIFDELPSGPFGAIVRLCGGAIVLLALLAVLSMVILRRSDIVMQLVIIMFLFFLACVVVYILRPPDDLGLAKGQSRRVGQISPKPITVQIGETP